MAGADGYEIAPKGYEVVEDLGGLLERYGNAQRSTQEQALVLDAL